MPKPGSEPAEQDPVEVGLRLLGRREHSRAELSAKLAARGFEAADVERALDRLQAMGALDESRFAEQFINMRLRQGYGPARIRSELSQRGVDAGAFDVQLAAAEEANDDAHWAARAEETRRRRFGAGVPNEYAERARQARFLERRGFSAAHIARVLRGAVDPDD